ncbi:hypothetical protein BH18THE2_BH18THE2_43040 [soil metagenome]
MQDSTLRNGVKEQVFRIYLDEERTNFTSIEAREALMEQYLLHTSRISSFSFDFHSAALVVLPKRLPCKEVYRDQYH